jgi:hypothetical protein
VNLQSLLDNLKPLAKEAIDNGSEPIGRCLAPTLLKAEIAMTRVELSDLQWNALQQGSRLHESARMKLNDELTLYRSFRQTLAKQPSASKTRNELLHIAELAEKLLTAIMGANGDARAALRGEFDNLAVGKILSGVKTSVLTTLLPQSPYRAANDELAGALAVSQGLGMPRSDALKLLCEWLSGLEQLRSWFESTACSLPAETTGAHKAAEHHLWLVGQLDAILYESTGRHVSRTYKNDYVKICFAAADPNVGPGSITKAIEAYTALNPRRRRAHAEKLQKKTDAIRAPKAL